MRAMGNGWSNRWTAAALSLAMALSCASADAARIKDLVEIQGARGNALQGIGIVVGLAGTGDNARGAILAQERMLRRLDFEVNSAADLNSDNVAVVVVTAEMPAFAKEGTRIDVNVSSLYDAESLEGGTLHEALREGAFAVLDMPLRMETMLETMRRVLCRHYADNWPGGASSN